MKGANMDYSMEELLPLMTWLTDKYTSKESTSVPYEKAQMLMTAIMYCLAENQAQYPVANQGKQPAVREMYERGYDIVIQKVYQAKELYGQIMAEFEDYGCRNYRDTVQNGIPAFFINYDPRFQPQDHLLTIDYPLISRNPDLCGADLILEYLTGIREEQLFLNCFDRQDVVRLLESIVPDYQELYFDNIADAALLRTVECFIAECPVRELVLNGGAGEEIRQYFEGDSIQDTQRKIMQIIRIIMQQFHLDGGYFEKAGPDYAVRLWHRLQKHEPLINHEDVLY